MKRIIDLTSSILLLAIGWPMLLIIYLLILLKIGKPVIFRQERAGLHGREFRLYKFRTMTNEVDEFGNLLPDELRISKLGNFLRKTSFDEFPQIFNVIKGDISLVGPRPLLTEYLPLYTPMQARRHEVKPGITGWQQVNGRNKHTWDEKFEYDLWYVENRSIWLDLKIIWLTVFVVLKSEGINHNGHVTMPKFTGSQKRKSM
jgi:sugar transferase EpsL